MRCNEGGVSPIQSSGAASPGPLRRRERLQLARTLLRPHPHAGSSGPLGADARRALVQGYPARRPRSRRMKVVFVGSLYAPNGVGGAERTVQTIAQEAVRRGHEAAVISLAPDGVARSGELNGVRTYYVPLANVHYPFSPLPRGAVRRALWHAIDAYNPWMARRVGRILDREQPDVLQTGNLLGFSAAVWHAARRRSIPVVQMLHDYYMGCGNSSMFKNGENCTRQCTACRVFTAPRRAMSDIPEAVISLSARLLERVEGTINRSIRAKRSAGLVNPRNSMLVAAA